MTILLDIILWIFGGARDNLLIVDLHKLRKEPMAQTCL